MASIDKVDEPARPRDFAALATAEERLFAGVSSSDQRGDQRALDSAKMEEPQVPEYASNGRCLQIEVLNLFYVAHLVF